MTGPRRRVSWSTRRAGGFVVLLVAAPLYECAGQAAGPPPSNPSASPATSGRYNSVVYAVLLTTGRVLARIRVGRGPHGLAVFPQPGRYSLGHTGVFR